jgi:hypothetical protein
MPRAEDRNGITQELLHNSLLCNISPHIKEITSKYRQTCALVHDLVRYPAGSNVQDGVQEIHPTKSYCLCGTTTVYTLDHPTLNRSLIYQKQEGKWAPPVSSKNTTG